MDTQLQDDTLLKKAFAKALVESPNNPFKAALSVFGTNTQLALHSAGAWVNDPIVVAEKLRISEALGPRLGCPTPEDQSRMLMKEIEALGEGPLYFEEKLKAHRLIAELLGNIKKPDMTVNNNPVQVNRIMVVVDHGSDSSWEMQLAAQQRKLVSGNTETRVIDGHSARE